MHEPLGYPMLVAAGSDGHIAGALTYDVRDGEMEAVTIDAFIEGAGAGRALIEAAAAEARRLGCRRLWLITTNDNTPALRFYQRCGMTLAALRRDAVGESRRLKPEIPETGLDDIPIRDELEFELQLLYGGSPAELDGFRQAGHALTDGVADYLTAVPSRPVWQPRRRRCASDCSAYPCRRMPPGSTSWSRRCCAMSCHTPWATATRPSSAGSTRRRRPPASPLRWRPPR